MKKVKTKTPFNYRHLICIIITLGFIAVSVFVFPNSFGRLIEALRDLVFSIGFCFSKILHLNYNIPVTVNDYAKTPLFPWLENNKTPSTSLPENFDNFKICLGQYWKTLASTENFFAYLAYLYESLRWIMVDAILLFFAGLILRQVFKQYFKTINNKYAKETRPLRAFKKVAYWTYRPVKIWLIAFVTFVKEHKKYIIIWVCLWTYNFNFFTIILEAFAYLFYFVVSWDIVSLYRQVYKLALDLWTVIDFMPLWALLIAAYVGVNEFCKRRAYAKLYHYERRNRGFLNERGVVTIFYGAMGAGKTTQATDCGLSAEVQFRDDALEIILETDMHFPYFPWITFERQLKFLFRKHIIYDLPSCRKWIRKKCKKWLVKPRKFSIYGYEFERYGLFYDDNLKLTSIWEALEDYACAYFIYTVQSSLLITNYSVRVDNLFTDLGNFPLWDCDFFHRDSRLIDSFSRHSHILDFDMLRLGKKMLEDNPNRNAFGFGVYIISEIDKERKNTLELKEVRATADECNQKNDLFNATLKMSRHPCVVANRVFVRIIADLQRTSSLGADALELGEVIDIVDKGDMSPCFPFFSPFYIIALLQGWLHKHFMQPYLQYRFNRADNTLFLHICKSVVSKLDNYVERVNNLFSAQTLKLQVQNGTGKGDIKDKKWFRMPKKIYSKRFRTDCLNGLFEVKAETNRIGINDLKSYADIAATNAELGLQNSHFYNEINELTKMSV